MKVLDIYFEKIKVEENGRKKDDEAINLIEFSLIYPREGVSKVTTIKKAKLEDNIEKGPENPSYEDTIIFRESIRGRCQLNVQVSYVDKPSGFEKFLGLVFKGLVSGLFKKKVDAVSSVISGKVIETIGSSVTKAFGESEDKNIIIAEGELEFDIDNLPSGTTEIPLTVKDAIKFPKYDIDQQRYIDKVFKQAGAANGVIKINFNEL